MKSKENGDIDVKVKLMRKIVTGRSREKRRMVWRW